MTDERRQGVGIGTSMKRRGILAAAAAAVAGIVAKQVAEESPVRANDGTWQFPYIGSTSSALAVFSVTNANGDAINGFSTNGIGMSATSQYGNGVYGGSTSNHGIYGNTGGLPNSGFAGVYGSSSSHGTFGVYGISPSGVGVYGTSITNYAVYGNSTNGTGVYGSSDTNFGVSGGSTSNIGVYGRSTNYVGVYGGSSSNYAIVGITSAPTNSGYAGVYGLGNGDGTFGVVGDGLSGSGVGVKGTAASGTPVVGAVQGTGSATNGNAAVLGLGTKGPGMQGQSTGGHGLVGTTSATDGHAGLVGMATNAGGVGVQGIAPGYGTQSVGKAGDFYGNVKITGGTLSAPIMQAVVPHQGDNTYRLLHTVASPDAWFEDAGDGTLTNGKAEITLDTDFAALIHTDAYHVFLTEYGDHHSLFVATRSASGFVVQAKEPVNPSGVKAPTKGVSGTFSWRVMAKRKDVTSERLAKVAAPTAPKVPTAFTLPATPEVKPPEAKPPTAKA